MPCSACAVNPVISTWAALTVTTRRSASAMITPSAMLPSALAATRRSCSIATRSETSRTIAWLTSVSPQRARLLRVSTGRTAPSPSTSAFSATSPWRTPSSRHGVVHVQRVVREQAGEVLADQLALAAPGPGGRRAVGIEDAAVALVDHHDRIAGAVEQQAVALLAAADALHDAPGHPHPQHRGQAEGGDHAPEQQLPGPYRALDHLHREQLGARLHQTLRALMRVARAGQRPAATARRRQSRARSSSAMVSSSAIGGVGGTPGTQRFRRCGMPVKCRRMKIMPGWEAGMMLPRLNTSVQILLAGSGREAIASRPQRSDSSRP